MSTDPSLNREPDPPGAAAGAHRSALSITLHTVAEVSGARRQVRVWAIAAGVDADTAHDLGAATYEAMANGVEHAYPQQTGVVVLTAAHHGDHITLKIGDEGRWRPPPADPGWRGRGLALIEGLGGRLDIHPSSRGTTITIHWPLLSPPSTTPDGTRRSHT